MLKIERDKRNMSRRLKQKGGFNKFGDLVDLTLLSWFKILYVEFQKLWWLQSCEQERISAVMRLERDHSRERASMEREGGEGEGEREREMYRCQLLH